MNQLAREDNLYTYADYIKLPDDNNYEIISGILNMTPAPNTEHQRLVSKLFLTLGNYFKDNPCEVFTAPYDVLLPNKGENVEDTKNIVQPDLMVICDKSKLTPKHCLGSPDFIIEIVSPASVSMDYIKKTNLYQSYQVKEYWIVDPLKKRIVVYKLEQDEFTAPEVYTSGNLESTIFKGLFVSTADIF